MKPRILGSSTIYKGKVFEVNKVSISEGASIFTRDIITHPGSAVMVPVVDIKKGSILMIRQWRHAAGGLLVEFPAGTREKGESFAVCARREVLEETGYSSGRIIRAVKFFLAPGTMTEEMALFICSKLSKKQQHLDRDERISVFTTTVKKAVGMALSGRIKDAKTLAALMFIDQVYRNKGLFKKYFPG